MSLRVYSLPLRPAKGLEMHDHTTYVNDLHPTEMLKACYNR